MKNKAFFKILLGITLVALFSAFIFVLTTPRVYASNDEGEIVDTLGEEETTTTEEVTTTTEQEQEEAPVTLTEEEKSKLDKIVEWLSNLNKEELFELLGTVKNWLIAGGIVTVITFLSAVIGLIVAILKLQRQKLLSSNKEEEQKKKELERIEQFEALVRKKNDEVKMLLLNLINNATDEEKKAIEANITDVRAKITKALEESKTTEQE